MMIKNILFVFALCVVSSVLTAKQIRVAVFNVSMEANNYIDKGQKASSQVLAEQLASASNQQIKNIAEIIQIVDPDIVLLNEFDLLDERTGIEAFKTNYLEVPQSNQTAIQFPYHYVGTVNTGLPSPFDFNNDGKKSGYANDAFGYGLYEGHYGMAILSKYPILDEQIRSLQTFKWKDMPGALKPFEPESKEPWYEDQEWEMFRLSSKSHWDVPVVVDGKTIHLLAMHPTPPNFDGAEDRNGKRNHDEIRLMADYLSPKTSQYIYDDKGVKGGLKLDSRFVLLGDFNAADIGDKHRPGVIEQLTLNPLVNNDIIPISKGGDEHSDESFSNRYTAYWGARVDYALPSRFGFEFLEAGVFWPEKSSAMYKLVESRKASSDHRLVWIDLKIKP